MRLSAIRLGVLLVPSCLVAAGTAGAQPVPARPAPAPAADRAVQPTQLRSQMSIMEASLERAVQAGIQGAINQMPGIQFSGPPMWVSPRARGFKIEGYGVFFDVEVPVLPASITWSISVLNKNNEIALVNELNQLRAIVQSVSDEAKRAEIRKGLDRLQARVSAASLAEPAPPIPPQAQPGSPATLVSAGRTSPSAAPPSPSVAVPSPDELDEIYTREVKKALISVMLDYGTSLQIAPDEWFTVAAAESRSSWGQPETMTVYLSIQGKDLAALRARQITPDEAAKRVVVRNY